VAHDETQAPGENQTGNARGPRGRSSDGDIFRVAGRFPAQVARVSAFAELRQTIARLRAPGGCPWDQEQTHDSLVRCLIDEVSELIDTIDRQDLPHMREELGDVLIQVIFHAQLAEEGGHFDLEDVAREVNAKLIRRHPHVFGDGDRLGSSGEVLVQWEAIKARERKAGPPTAAGLFKNLPPRLPALMYAEAIWKQVRKKEVTALTGPETRTAIAAAADLDDATLGRRLFALTAAAQEQGLDPEGALRREADRVKAGVSARVEADAESKHDDAVRDE